MANKTTKVKNGTIILPKKLWKIWKGTEVYIQVYKDRLIIEKPQPQQEATWKVWKKASGILKGRKIPNPVIWQRSIRREWERTSS